VRRSSHSQADPAWGFASPISFQRFSSPPPEPALRLQSIVLPSLTETPWRKGILSGSKTGISDHALGLFSPSQESWRERSPVRLLSPRAAIAARIWPDIIVPGRLRPESFVVVSLDSFPTPPSSSFSTYSPRKSPFREAYPPRGILSSMYSSSASFLPHPLNLPSYVMLYFFVFSLSFGRAIRFAPPDRSVEIDSRLAAVLDAAICSFFFCSFPGRPQTALARSRR